MPYRARQLRNLLLVALVAALCFGGSFTCRTDSGNDDDNGFSGSVNVN